jgi:hypothetical protein
MKKIAYIFVGLFTAIWLGLITYFIGYDIIFRKIDQSNCLNQFSENTGYEASYTGLLDYVHESTKAGMSRNEVHSILNGLGDTTYDYYLNSTGNFEYVYIDMCKHPLNNVEFYIHYDDKENLLLIDYSKDDWKFE